MPDHRPNADALLARVQADEERSKRGKLKIYFGYAAGVGKTYAMLEEARRQRDAGVDVVVGYVEPHGRRETESLVEGLEVLAPRLVPYRGVLLREFDLDAALARRPALVLVDELAHTNAEGSRHAKRWQDVDELLAAGVDVYATLNVQHLESLNDVIAQITGVVVRETLPDSVLEQTDDIELIDITPEELLRRLESGKVYIPQQAERALQNFFQRAHLVALREISLRQTARRIQREVEAERQAKSPTGPWATTERLMVCVGPSPTTAKLIRTARRMAVAFEAEWLAVAVQTPGKGAHTEAKRQRVGQHLRLAEQLGAETRTLVGSNVAQTVLEYARSRNVARIVVGKTAQPWWRRLVSPTVVDALLETSGDIDIYVIKGEPDSTVPRPVPATQRQTDWRNYLATAAVVCVCSLLGLVSRHWHLAEANTIMVFLLGVAFVATRYGRGPAIAASVASVALFDFIFVPPYYRFAVTDAQYLLTFGVMLTIGLLISTLTARVRDQLDASQQQERRTAALFRLTRQLGGITGVDFLIRAAGQQLGEIFAGEVVIYFRGASGPVELRFGEHTSVARHEVNGLVAQWVADHDQTAGVGTDTLPNATALFVPLVGSQRTVGALGIKANELHRLLDPEQRRLLDTCASLIALAIERDQSVLDAQNAQVQIHTEQLRSSLLSSVSHDLRTPLAAIAGVSTTLIEGSGKQSETERLELLHTLVDESHRLTRLVDNLLDMTRLEAGSISLNTQWHVLEEIVGSALGRLRDVVKHHPVRVDIPQDMPLVRVDGLLLEQVFVNLVENAAKYTPDGTAIEISARGDARQIVVRVADNGPGISAGSETRIFEKFYRGTAGLPDGRRGVGLGLAICQAIVEAHHGRITAANRPTQGAEFVITLKCEESAPRVPLDEVAVSSNI